MTHSATTAYDYPLLIKQLLYSTEHAPDNREIVSGEHLSLQTMRPFAIGLPASQTASRPSASNTGDTVAVMDWDGHRYLECFFAVPMMGAILHTINVRLSPEQILYTINHAEDDVILVHADFQEIIAQISEPHRSARQSLFIVHG